MGDGNSTRVSILQAAHIHLNSDMMLHTSARYRRETTITAHTQQHNPHASLLTDSTAITPHTQHTTQKQSQTWQGKRETESRRFRRKERAEFKTNIRRKRKTKNNKKSKEDFWGASTYWIILEIWNTIWQHTLPFLTTHLVQKRHCQ